MDHDEQLSILAGACLCRHSEGNVQWDRHAAEWSNNKCVHPRLHWQLHGQDKNGEHAAHDCPILMICRIRTLLGHGLESSEIYDLLRLLLVGSLSDAVKGNICPLALKGLRTLRKV